MIGSYTFVDRFSSFVVPVSEKSPKGINALLGMNMDYKGFIDFRAVTAFNVGTRARFVQMIVKLTSKSSVCFSVACTHCKLRQQQC